MSRLKNTALKCAFGGLLILGVCQNEEIMATDVDLKTAVESDLETGTSTNEYTSKWYVNKDEALDYYVNLSGSIDGPLLFEKKYRYVTYRMISCDGKYSIKATIKDYNKMVDVDFDELADNIGLENLSDVEKCMKVHEWLCNKLTYGKSNGSLSEVLATGIGKCDDYSILYSGILNAVGVECRCMDGVPKETLAGHMWNMVRLGNSWYFCDVTNDDLYNTCSYMLRSIYSKKIQNYLHDDIYGDRLCNGIYDFRNYNLSSKDYYSYYETTDSETINMATTLGISKKAAVKASCNSVQIKGKTIKKVKKSHKIKSYDSFGIIYGKIGNKRYIIRKIG